MQLEVQRYLAQMVEAGMEYAVIEATSHGLAQHRLDAVEFDIAAVTNITHEHLDLHGSWENYRDAKALLFQCARRVVSQAADCEGRCAERGR